jgi:hypothetical protein
LQPASAVQFVFTLASGRSGTHFLAELLRRNAVGCRVRHEPYGWNPSMFGRPIYDRAVGDLGAVRSLAMRKVARIRRGGAASYVETSHAFLKSWSEVAAQLLPDLRLVHLVRDPLYVAKSEANRHDLIDWLHLPLAYYRGGDGRRYFRWSLTGLEPIFQHFAGARLSRFQWYAIQWIEIENRAMQFRDFHAKRTGCFTLHSPQELNAPQRIGELLDFLRLKRRQSTIAIGGRRNRNPRPTVITDDDRREFAEVVRLLPASSLAIFGREPYAQLPWAALLQTPAPPAHTPLVERGEA